MKVRAKAWGYYGNIGRNPGEVFTLKAFKTHRLVTKSPKTGATVVSKSEKPILISAEEQFSEEWMEKVDSSVPVQKVKKAKGRSDAFPPEQAPQARDANHPRENEVEHTGLDEGEEIDERNNDESVI